MLLQLRQSLRWISAFAITILFGAVPLFAATITVNSGADAGGTCPGATCTLRQAIADAGSGDTINFSLPAGTTAITLTSDQLLISKNLTISGPGANLLSVVRGRNPLRPFFHFRIFEIDGGNVTISGLTIVNGSPPTNDLGGGIYNARTLTIANCTVSGNSSDQGGGIYNAGTATLSVTNSTISGNSCQTHGAGIYNAHATLSVTNSTISGNSANAGGGIYNYGGTLTVANSTIAGNSATHSGSMNGVGGGIYNFPNIGGTANAKNTIIARNTAGNANPDFDGTLTSEGFNLIGNNSGATITPARPSDQIGTPGAPIDPMLGPLQDNGGPTPTHALQPGSPATDKGDSSGSPIDQRDFPRPVDSPNIPNAAGGDGSDIGAYEDQVPCQTVVTNNSDSGPGSLRAAIANACTGATITFAPGVVSPINLTSGELLIQRPMTISGPGAGLMTVRRSASAGTNFSIFHISSGAVTPISGLTITKGNPNHDGGGIYIDSGSTLSLTGCAVTGNSANSAGQLPGRGGGIATGDGASAAGIVRSTISGNSATGDGGGIYVASLDIDTSTIAGNSAARYGGGISATGAIRVLNSTIANNTAATGGGVKGNGYSVNVGNTIVAKNTATTTDPDFSGTFISQEGYNLIGNTTGTIITGATTGNQLNVDPKIGPLQNNDGPTQTCALLTGSPAIDQGSGGGVAHPDQRGVTRPYNYPNIANAADGEDMGAFELATPPIPPTVLANISTRLRVETGNNALIGGFIVTGTQPKKIIVRAIGPSLSFAGKLADPILELHDSAGALLETNDNWVDSPNKQAIIDSTIPPTNDLESAIVRSVAPGNYTAIVRGVNNGIGIGVVEAYDLDTTANSKLANISTRGLVQGGDNVLIAGTIVVGQASQKVIIRALGPSTGVRGALADPTLELHDSNGALLETNDNWVDSPNKQAIINSTIPPPNDLESAIVRTLSPANYTAIVRGVNNSTGIAVVEVYALN